MSHDVGADAEPDEVEPAAEFTVRTHRRHDRFLPCRSMPSDQLTNGDRTAEDLKHLERTIELADEAVAEGNHPFASVLVDATGTVIAEGKNEFLIDKGPGHAETNLARRAAREFPIEQLRGSTLYTSVEPCSMCAGTVYWAEIGAVVFGMTEKRLAELTTDDPMNQTQDLECRTVFAAGQRPVAVRGPFPEVENRIVEQHRSYWKAEPSSL